MIHGFIFQHNSVGQNKTNGIICCEGFGLSKKTRAHNFISSSGGGGSDSINNVVSVIFLVESRIQDTSDWAWHLWDTLSTSTFSLVLSVHLCLRIRPSAVGWTGVRAGQTSLRTGTQLTLYIANVLATESGWSPSAEHFIFWTLQIYGIDARQAASKQGGSWWIPSF